MGGPGSGNFRRSRHFVEECICVRLPDLRRLGLIQTGHVRSASLEIEHSDGRITPIWVSVDASLDTPPTLTLRLTQAGRRIEHQVALEAVPQPRGGHRWLALCPLSGARCRTLVLQPDRTYFASVAAQGLTYAVRSLDIYGRAHKRAEKALQRLGGLSKYARTKTRQRLWETILERDDLIDELIERTQLDSGAGFLRNPSHRD